MNYKEDQKKFRELAKPKFFPKGTTIEYVTRKGIKAEYANGYPIPKNRKFTDPKDTKAKASKRVRKLNPERVLRIEEIRHLYSLARKGQL